MKRVRKVGDIEAVQVKLWRALLVAEKILEKEENTPEIKLKAVHCIIQLSGQYVTITEEVRKEKESIYLYG